MKRIKRWICCLIVLCMTMSMLPPTVFAEETAAASGTCGENLTWSLDEAGTLVISGLGPMSTRPWKDYRDDIVSIIIKDGVTEIGDYAFQSCGSLTNIEIPNSVTSIGNYALSYCSSLASIEIPDSVTSIGSGAFTDCSRLTKFIVSVNNSAYCAVDGILYDKPVTEIIHVPDSIKGAVVIPDGVTSIGYYEFADRSGLTSVVIADGVTEIGSHAFDDCSSLTSINIPNSVTSIHSSAFEDCSSLTSIKIPNTVTSIGSYAFSDCSSLTSIEIPNGVTSIGTHTFSFCSSLTSVAIPESVTSIGSYAFYYCQNLASVKIPNSVISIDNRAFFFCSSLTSIEIPDSVTLIGKSAFSNCSSLVSITVSEGNSVYHSAGNCLIETSSSILITGCKRSVIPDGVTSIGDEAFQACKGLASIEIPDTVTSIGDYAFSGCSRLTVIEIPNGVTSIGIDTFSYCRSLVSVKIPDSATTISNYAFWECNSMENIVIEDGVTSIGYAAFYGCNNLTNVYYSGSEEDWNAISIMGSNSNLFYATIHYNSTGPDAMNENSLVHYFREWDEEKQIAFFDGDIITGSQVTAETDTSFLENVDALVGQYVLTETKPRDDDMVGPDTLLSIKAVESKTGTVTAVDNAAKTVTIDGVTYAVNMSRTVEDENGSTLTELVDLNMYVDAFVLYHIYDGKIVGMETLKTEKGTLTYWNAQTGEVKITHENQSTAVCPLSRLADADTVDLLGGTGYFGLDVSYVTDSNSFLYRIERTPAVAFGKGYVLTAYSDRRTLSIQCGEELDVLCALYHDSVLQEDWSKPVFTTSNESVLSVTGCEHTDSGYLLTIKGGQPGTATVTVTDADSGAYVDFAVVVREESVVPYSYVIDEVPSFFPDAIGDTDTQTNFYNCNGLYVNSFPETTYKSNGVYQLSFTVYNSTNMYGSVDVYDANGNWYTSERIDKHTGITGLWDTAKGAFFLLYDTAKGDIVSYTAKNFSTETEISIKVPEGGYFTITNNIIESPGTYIYNSVDFLMMGVDMLADVVFSGADTKAVQEQTVNQILQTPKSYNTFLSSFRNIAQKTLKDLTKQGYGDAVEAFALSSFDLFDDMRFDFVGVVKQVCDTAEGIGEDIFVKCTPAAIGSTLKGIFKINKYLDRIYQVNDILNSEDKPYIRLYTPEASGGLTISGVTVDPDEGVLPDNAVLQVFRIANTEAMIVSDTGLVADQYELYNICFTVNNTETQPNGNVTVKIPVPAGYENDACIVLHQQENGNWQTVESEIENGFIVFAVNHFCNFAIVNSNAIPEAEVVASGECGDALTWRLTEDGVLTISGSGDMYDYWNQEKYDTTAPWHEYADLITSISMSDGITNIGSGAFYCCWDVTSVDISAEVTVIGDYAFYGIGTPSFVIPEGTTEVGKYAFARAEIDSITFPSTLKIVREGAFEWAGVENVYVPSMEAWCAIDFDSFFASPFLETDKNNLYVAGELVTDVVIPHGVTEIGVSQFAGYSSLSSIQIPSTVTRVEGFAFDMTPNGYGGSSQLTEIVFPASVEYIGERALGFNDNMQRIVILNPDCEIAHTIEDFDAEYFQDGMYVTWTENAPVIYGYSGSTAEAYASAEGFEFVALESYEIVSGENSTVKTGEELTIRASGAFSKFEGIAVDGLTVDPSGYAVYEGSTVVTFKAEYLNTLASGEHTITVFFVDGVATTTLTKQAYAPGDANGDGSVDGQDATLLLQYAAGWQVQIETEAADANGDGAVDGQDATLLLQYAAGWQVVLGGQK